MEKITKFFKAVAKIAVLAGVVGGGGLYAYKTLMPEEVKVFAVVGEDQDVNSFTLAEGDKSTNRAENPQACDLAKIPGVQKAKLTCAGVVDEVTKQQVVEVGELVKLAPGRFAFLRSISTLKEAEAERQRIRGYIAEGGL